MDFAEYVRIGSESPGLRFLLIGGIAVIAHGYSRLTVDIDFLVRAADAESWQSRIIQHGFSLFQKTATFAQFNSPSGGPAIDLMFVNDATFEQFWTSAQTKSVQGTDIKIPSLDHLLSLKLHALKHTSGHRTFKDADDVEMLCRWNKLNILDPHYERLFLKYGTREIYETLCRVLRHP